ncbi:MAG: HD-GYP domain-containing protein [Coriobacteriia bacterium]|nr:HD-GYP domain-containing protein [Coriobacteriia bacterium]
MENRDLRFAAFSAAVAITAFGPLYWAPRETSWFMGYRFWLLIAAVVISEVLAVFVSASGSMSLAYPLFVATSVLFGPIGGALAGMASMVPNLFARPRMTPSKFLFNTGQMMLTASVPGWVYVLLQGRPLAISPLVLSDIRGLALPLLAAAVVGVLVNFLLASLAIRLLYDVPLRKSWRDSFMWMIPSQLALGLVGLAIAQIVAVLGAAGFALFATPLVVARQVHQRYVDLKEAYSGTIRSLVAAIEAKDPYTKGHSVRVARYAVAIARGLDLRDEEVERIEYASLLHDLGKVGISRALLAKESALTDSEFNQIRQHPDIGAHILETVPFLADVRPIVQYHHERIDGAGYGQGIAGDAIPLAARILAVADSYDAMTSERPYRHALTHEDAVSELTAGVDRQFDADVVQAFIAAMPAMSEPAAGTLTEEGVALTHA